MAIIFFSGVEMGTLDEFPLYDGAISVSTTHKKTGAYALRTNPTNSRGWVELGGSFVNKKITFYLYIATASDTEFVLINQATEELWMTTDRKLKYGGTTGDTQLNTGTWYRISCAEDNLSSGGTVKVWINGILEFTVTDLDTEGEYWNYIGIYSPSTCTADIYIDDVVTDDSTDLTDLGDIRVQLAQPNAAGDLANFDREVPSKAVHYTTYDDPAGGIDDNDYVIHAAKTVVQDIANLESCSDAGLGESDIINAVKVCYRWKLSKDGDDLPSVYVKDNGTGYATQVPRDSDDVWYWDFKLYATNAPRGSAWTQEIFDAFQAGMQTSGASPDTYLSCIMVMVAYRPAAGGGVIIPILSDKGIHSAIFGGQIVR